MNKNNNYGECHICGKKEILTFEHIPPRKAANWFPAKIYNGDQALKKSQGKPAEYINMQQGMGKYSLCSECNNNTGTWYAQPYCDFTMDVMKYLSKKPSLEHGDIINFIFSNCPVLPIAKQVIAMFCSLLPHQLNMMLGFDDLLLSKENNVVRKDLFDLRMYLTSSNNGQLMCGPTAVLRDKNDYLEEVWVSDLAVYPFGFILNLTPKIPVEYGTSIMDMFDANYTELCTFALPLMYLERYNEKFPLPLIFKKIAS